MREQPFCQSKISVRRRPAGFVLPLRNPLLPMMDGDRAQHGRASVARNAGVISLAVTASRVLGLVRDQVFAVLFGAGLQYDAFLTAFRIPNLLRDLFAEGALSAAFVTTFSQVLAKKGEAEAFRLSNRVATLLMLLLGIICIAGWLAAPDP